MINKSEQEFLMEYYVGCDKKSLMLHLFRNALVSIFSFQSSNPEGTMTDSIRPDMTGRCVVQAV